MKPNPRRCWRRVFMSILLIIAEIESVQTSCGFGVPLFEYTGQRSTLIDYAEKLGPDGIAAYRAEKNVRSIDGLPTGLLNP